MAEFAGSEAYTLYVWADIARLPFRQVKPTSRLPTMVQVPVSWRFVQASGTTVSPASLGLGSVALNQR